jgi:hypothetical protein
VVVLLIGATLRWAENPRFPVGFAIGVLHGVALLLRAEHALLLVAFLGWGVLATRSEKGLRYTGLIAVAAIAVCLPWSWRSHLATKRFNEVESSAIDFENARPPWTKDAQDFLNRLPAFARQGNFAYEQALAQKSEKRKVDQVDVERFFSQHFGYVPEPLSEWTLVSSKAALDFALANHPASDGGFSRAALYDGTDLEPEFALGRPSHLKLYNHGFAVGWASIRADFGAWTHLVARKFERFFEGVTLGWTAYDMPYGRASHRAPIDLATPIAGSIVARVGIGLAILAGIFVGCRRNLGALCLIVIGYKLVVTTLFYGYARQAVSIEPALFIFGAIAIDAMFTRLRCPPRIATALGIAAVLALVGCDIASYRGSHDFEIHPMPANSRILKAPDWGPGAFESFGEIEILPR